MTNAASIAATRRWTNRWKIVSTVIAAVATIFLPSRASAELRVAWDCYLPNTSVDCATLESSLTSKIPFLTIVPANGNPEVIITLASIPVEDGARFNLDVVGEHEDAEMEVRTTDKIPSTIGSGAATVRILTKLERALDDFMDQKIVAEVRSGTLDIQLIDPIRLPFTGRTEQSSVKWYVAPTVSTYFSDVVGVGVNASGSAAVTFNDSERYWRIQQSLSANYSRQSQPVPGTSETASIQFEGGNVTNVFSRALSPDNRWSLGLLVAGEKNPQANYTLRANASLGIEFDDIPRQTVNQKNLGFRCAFGPEFQRYDATNVENRTDAVLAREFCDVFVNWHFVPIDVWTSLGETALLEDVSYRSFSASASVVWRLTDNLTISPWVNVQQVNNAINEALPSNVVYSDPRQEIEASMLAAVQQGYTAPFGIQSGLSVRYLFGNGSLSLEDQRWKGASNLR